MAKQIAEWAHSLTGMHEPLGNPHCYMFNIYIYVFKERKTIQIIAMAV